MKKVLYFGGVALVSALAGFAAGANLGVEVGRQQLLDEMKGQTTK